MILECIFSRWRNVDNDSMAEVTVWNGPKRKVQSFC